MTDGPAAGTVTAGRGGKLLAYVAALLALVAAIAGVITLFDTRLPGCTTTGTSEALHRILREKNIQNVRITDRRELSADLLEVRCAAVLEIGDGGLYDLSYRINREDLSGPVTVHAEWRRR
ncbi:hypothetical protein [Phreatobacter sp.]|uniref:hypothetical protein n=1 Tax=Phreatobacter sp. TaxID=1966341 RepID=UPI0025E838D5|nr:hypothetical protein [Phreatobacter sp.]